jgi:glycosyltransferase involved in cell wall biosynthesis
VNVPKASERVTRAVLHYVQDWLPLSEQFVHAWVTRSAHRGVVVSRKTPHNRDTFPFRPVVSFGRLFPPPRPFTESERRTLTAALLAVATRHRTALIHQHHGYRIRDVIGLVHRRRLPWIVSFHGHDVLAHANEYPGYYAGVFDYITAAIVPSQWLVPHVVDLGADPSTVRVIPSGVDTTFFTPTPSPTGPPEVLFAGRFVEKKGIDVLLAAWPVVRRAVPDATLRLLGFGPLEALARSGVAGVVVEDADATNRAHQLREAIRRCTVVVTPSRTAANGDAETLLLVNLEAQACGRPVVTTRHGGIPEYVDEGVTALVVDENQPEPLADALIALLRDRDKAAAMGSAGPAWAARFDVEVCVREVDALYDSLPERVERD